MSQSIDKNEKVVTAHEFAVCAAIKAAVHVFQNEMRLNREALTSSKPASVSDGLLKAMQADAVNDDYDIGLGDCLSAGRELDKKLGNNKSELKELGQWVFEGQDEKWLSAATNSTGQAYLHNIDKDMMYFDHRVCSWFSKSPILHEIKRIEGCFDPSGFAKGFVARETVNDVEYLSDNDSDESAPHIDDVLDHPNWLSESAHQITQADMQLIFIKNLSSTLIQRMHSMERFSEEDYGIGGENLMAWDIVYDVGSNQFGLVSGYSLDKSEYSSFFFGAFNQHTRLASSFYMTTGELRTSKIRTITESQIKDFNAALEVFYG